MSEARKMTSRITLRALPEDLLELQERASSARLSVPEYLRRCGLGRRIDHHAKTTNEALRELSRIGNNLNQFVRIAHVDGVSREQAAVVLSVVKEAASSLIGKGPSS